jgi:hypothetical protein
VEEEEGEDVWDRGSSHRDHFHFVKRIHSFVHSLVVMKMEELHVFSKQQQHSSHSKKVKKRESHNIY